jgi:hypothetical protein
MSKRKLENGGFNESHSIYFKDEFTKEQASKQASIDEDMEIEVDDLKEGFVKYYPKTSKEDILEYGENGLYKIIYTKQRGAIPVWIVEL